MQWLRLCAESGQRSWAALHLARVGQHQVLALRDGVGLLWRRLLRGERNVRQRRVLYPRGNMPGRVLWQRS